LDIDHKELKRDLNTLRDKAQEIFKSMNIPEERRKLTEMEAETFSENFWTDQERSTRINKEIVRVKKKIEPWEKLVKDLNDAIEMIDIAVEEKDNSILAEIYSSMESLQSTYTALETKQLLAGKDDVANAFLTVHAGAGGTESQDWASMLLRMYMRWAEKQGFAVDMIDYMPGEEAGIKGATIKISGEYAYGMLMAEMGVHRLVRISPFDANKRRHTSFASVETMPELAEDIVVDINESDLRIDTYRSSGSGGQHVNTTDSAIRITHIPTNTVVTCQNERSQHKNKATAMKWLQAKLYELEKQAKEKELSSLAGEKKDIGWGSQIRSYVFQPYTLVKDHRTNEETGSVDFVLDGDINRFIYAYLKMKNKI
jgi:peptide chain release factor 2